MSYIIIQLSLQKKSIQDPIILSTKDNPSDLCPSYRLAIIMHGYKQNNIYNNWSILCLRVAAFFAEIVSNVSLTGL